MDIEERVARLERENRDLKRVLLALLAGVAATAIVALIEGSTPASIVLLITAAVVLALMEARQSELPEIIRAQKFEVVGADGVTRVVLGETIEGDGAVATYDADGHFVAALDPRTRKPQSTGTGAPPTDAHSSYGAKVRRKATAIRASQR